VKDWNVVASTREEEFVPAIRFLGRWGRVERTDYYNVVVLRVEDRAAFLEELRESIEAQPGILNFIGRIVPAERTFDYQSREEFEEKVGRAALAWVPLLAGKSFHVRMHRRGFKRQLSSQEEERQLAGLLLDELAEVGSPGQITFEDPDAILAIETVGARAGLSLWTREDRKRYSFLGLT
jgi:tRNA(Ser,Leu) C12 N-acetylase TAN1